MNLSTAKYVFTITGGGFTPAYELYVITKDKHVCYLNDPQILKKDITELDKEPEYLFDLPEMLDFTKHGNNVGFAAPDCTMYKVKNDKLRPLYCVGMYRNTPAVDTIIEMHCRHQHGLSLVSDANIESKKPRHNSLVSSIKSYLRFKTNNFLGRM